MSLDTISNDHVTAIALRAITIAYERHHEVVTLEHILAALLERADVQKCLTEFHVDYVALQEDVKSFLDSDERKLGASPPVRAREFDMVLGRTVAFAQFSARHSPNGIDVLLQCMQMPEETFAVRVLTRYGVDTVRLKKHLALRNNTKRIRPEGDFVEAEPTDKGEAIGFIRKYCTDLNELARGGKIDPVIGRQTELERITQIITRRRKNNVALVGKSGTGKTAVVEGLACKIVQQQVPQVIRGCTIWALDVGALIAGTRFRGDFEERMTFLIKAFGLIAEDRPILFIDEIHTIMDAGSGHKGSLDVSNLLKPALARGSLRCIGSTTDKDWRQHFEKDRALLRRFKKLVIDEPSVADAKAILRGLKQAHENFHNVSYTDAALDAAVDLTVRYVHDGQLPDKAIDVIDEAGARQQIMDNGRTALIDVAEIEAEVARVVQIPVHAIRDDEASRLERLESDLLGNVFGQERAIETLVDAVLISHSGLRDPSKPAGSFLLAGPSGTGKTEVARQLAKTLGLPLVKFDMSEYMEQHSVAKLIGAPPGYIGFGDGAAGDGLLINAVDLTPSCVLLLDEIEKAHFDIFNVLLQIMDDARLTNSGGKEVNFRNVILIMTSNVGVAATEQHGIGFHPEMATIDEREIQRTFSPEFRNRLDAIVIFDALDQASIRAVTHKFLDELRHLLSMRNVTLEISGLAEAWLIDHGYDSVYGARVLTRLIHQKIKRPLSRMLLFGPLKQGGRALVTMEGDEIVVLNGNNDHVFS